MDSSIFNKPLVQSSNNTRQISPVKAAKPSDKDLQVFLEFITPALPAHNVMPNNAKGYIAWVMDGKTRVSSGVKFFCGDKQGFLQEAAKNGVRLTTKKGLREMERHDNLAKDSLTFATACERVEHNPDYGKDSWKVFITLEAEEQKAVLSNAGINL